MVKLFWSFRIVFVVSGFRFGRFACFGGFVSFVSVVSFRLFRVSFRLFRWFRFACFGGFVSFVSVVSFRLFRWFRFVCFGGFVSFVSVVSFHSFRWFRFARFVSLFWVLVHAPKQFATLKSNFCLELPAIHQMSKNIFPITNFRKLYKCWESISVKHETFSEQNRMSMRKTVDS